MKRIILTTVLLLSGIPSYAEIQIDNPITLKQCIDIAITNSASVDQASAKVEEYRARLKEVQSNYYPKLSVLSYVAPMFTVNGDAFTPDVERKFDLGSWGPSTHIEALLAMPIYSFGRIEAGELAASERLEVEKAALREAQNLIKVEVTKFYYSYLYAITIKPHLVSAKDLLVDVQEKAQELYDSSSGKVTKADLMKLKYGETEVQKYILLAEEGSLLAMSALKHTMGLEDSVTLALEHQKIPKIPNSLKLADEAVMNQEAIENRPEWAQLRHGLKAANALRDAQKRSSHPLMFVAGTFEHNWTPTRDDSLNPYHNDEYNDIFGGVAVGIQWNLDWALTRSKMDSANATLMEVNALKKMAVTGIPLQIKKARTDMQGIHQRVKLAKTAQKATNKWVVFSGAAYASGTGEVKDVLEGLVAQLTAKRDYYEGMLNFYIAEAELNYVLGK